MIPWEPLGVARVPGGDNLRLMRRGTEFSIMLGATELMNSRLSGSEEALATLVCARLRPQTRPRLLVGGLGLGFTLRAALAQLGPGATVAVAELVRIVQWARGPMAGLFGNSLEDRRVEIIEADVVQVIRASESSWDANPLDVDNGPHGLTRPQNDVLYGLAGLGRPARRFGPEGFGGLVARAGHPVRRTPAGVRLRGRGRARARRSGAARRPPRRLACRAPVNRVKTDALPSRRASRAAGPAIGGKDPRSSPGR